MMLRKLVLLLSILPILLIISGCTTRGPNSQYIGPPVDVERETWEEEIRRISSVELQLPQTTNYQLGPGDQISLSLVGRSDILGGEETGERFKVEITQNPSIVLPYVGAIRAHGKTPEQLQLDIQNAYKTIVRDPIVILTVDRYFYNQVTVIGSVQMPARYDLQVGDTVLDAIFRAGGLTFGGRDGVRSLPPGRTIKIYRDKVSQESRLNLSPEELFQLLIEEDGKIVPRNEITLPLDEFIFGGNLTYNIPLEPNDIIFIAPAGTVSVHGPVINPRVVFLGPGLRTVVQVLTESGGLKFKAASTIEVVRTTEDGTTESYFMDARKMRKRKVEDFVLEDNDQIFAYHHPIRSVFDVIGSVFKGTASAGVNATYTP